jgi:hypothetical protein
LLTDLAKALQARPNGNIVSPSAQRVTFADAPFAVEGQKMTFVTVAPDLVEGAAGVLARIEADLSAAKAALAPTMELAPAGADEVSAAAATLFGGYGRAFQAISAEAAAFHHQFVQAMTAAAGSYTGVEAASASLLQNPVRDVQGAVNAVTQTLWGRPLFGAGGSSGGRGGTANMGSSGAAGANASAAQPSAPSPTTTSDTGGIALVMGPTGIPQPSASYVATVERLYLAPLGFHGHAESLYTPELGYNTDANLPTDVANLMAAINTQMATGHVSAQNPIWVFGYSQSAAAASQAMMQLHAEGVPATDLHFVLVGDPASATGGILNTLLPSLGPLGDAIKPLLPFVGLSQTMGLTTPNYYPTDVYTLAGDGYAAWPTNFLSNPVGDITAVAGLFTTHEEYLGLSPGQIQAATPTYTDGLAHYHTIDNNSSQLLPTLINAAVNVGWISPATGQILHWLF